MTIKTWQETHAHELENYAILPETRSAWQQHEIAELRAANLDLAYQFNALREDYLMLKQANSDLAAASIIPEGYQLVPIENIQYSVDWGTNGDRTCVSIVKKHSDGHLEVVAAAYEPRKGKKS